jgi:hypothetical protein
MKQKRKPGSGGKRKGAGRPKKFGDAALSLIKFFVPTEHRPEIHKECTKIIDKYRED